jgi:hypothetical protein
MGPLSRRRAPSGLRRGGGARNYTEILTDTGGYVIGRRNGRNRPRGQSQGNNPQPESIGPALARAAARSGAQRHRLLHVRPSRPRFDYPPRPGGKTYPAVQFRGDHGTTS